MSEVYMNIRRYCYTTGNSQTRIYSEVDTENLGLRIYARHLNRPERPKIILVENMARNSTKQANQLADPHPTSSTAGGGPSRTAMREFIASCSAGAFNPPNNMFQI
jgi:hypothetical protein